MTSQPPEPTEQWPPSQEGPPSPEGRQAGRGQRPAGPPGEWAGGSLQRYPDLTGHPRDDARPGWPDYPRVAYHPGGHSSMPDYPPMPDYPSTHEYPPTPDYPPERGYRTAAGYQPGYPATEYLPAGYPTTGYPADSYPAAECPAPAHPAEAYPAAEHRRGGPVPPMAEVQTADGRWVLESPPVSHEEYVHRGETPAQAVPVDAARVDAVRADAAPADAAPAAGSEHAQWSMLAYLTVPIFGFLVPLAVYLLAIRGSRWVRDHAAQAINVWLTVFLYDLSVVIIGAILVFDSPQVALTVVVTLIAVLWLTALAFLVRAATAAGRGETYTFPRWLCTRMVR